MLQNGIGRALWKKQQGDNETKELSAEDYGDPGGNLAIGISLVKLLPKAQLSDTSLAQGLTRHIGADSYQANSQEIKVRFTLLIVYL